MGSARGKWKICNSQVCFDHKKINFIIKNVIAVYHYQLKNVVKKDDEIIFSTSMRQKKKGSGVLTEKRRNDLRVAGYTSENFLLY